MTDLEALRKELKPQLSLVPTGRTDVPTVSVQEAKKDLLLSRRGKTLLRARATGGEDRSARLFELASLLRDAGAEPDEAFTLLRASVWNKFQGRDDEVERLWEAVDRSFANGPEDMDGRRVARQRGSRATPLSSLLARDLGPSEWAVERIWGHQSYGFVAGEPKTYKSTLTTDLAVSVATATPFLGHFDVVHPGGVLIVQEENTQNIQRSRFLNILRERGLTGKVHDVGRAGIEVTMPTECPVYSLDRTGFNFGSKRKRRALEQEVATLQPALLVIDPLQMVMGDLSLRSETDVAKALGWLNYLNNTYHCGILIVHHYHKRREDGPQLGGQRMLGSQALHAWLECGLYIQRVHGTRLKVNREYRAFVDPGPFELEFEAEDDEDLYRAVVHEQERSAKQAALLDVVQETPWKTADFYAKALGKDRTSVLRMAGRLDLTKRKQKPKKGSDGGRPVIVYGPPSVG